MGVAEGTNGLRDEDRTPPSPEQDEEQISLPTLATIATAVLAVAGAIWFGLLSFGAAIAYSPVGVEPREIGLSSGTVLAQSAIGLTVLILVFAFTELSFWRRLGVEKREKAAPAPRISPLRHQLATGYYVLVIAVAFLSIEAWNARSNIEAGRRTDPVFPIGLASPWSGQIADLAWAEAKPAEGPALPACALYLGQAGGTVVFYDAGEKQTWRLPSSALIITVKPDRNECEAKPSEESER